MRLLLYLAQLWENALKTGVDCLHLVLNLTSLYFCTEMYRRSGRKRKPTSLATTVGKWPRAAPRLSVAATVHSATSTSTVLPPCQQSIQSPFATVAMPLPSPMPVTYPVIPVTTTSQVSQTAIFTTSSNPTVPVLSASSAVLGNSWSQEPHDITLANTLFEQASSQILSIHSGERVIMMTLSQEQVSN